MRKIVVNTTTTPLTVFAHLAIPVGSLDLAEVAAEALGRDPVIAALMDAGLVAIEEREEPASASSSTEAEAMAHEAVEADERDKAAADLPQPAAFPPEAPAEGAGAEPAPAEPDEPKADKPASKKSAAKA